MTNVVLMAMALAALFIMVWTVQHDPSRKSGKTVAGYAVHEPVPVVDPRPGGDPDVADAFDQRSLDLYGLTREETVELAEVFQDNGGAAAGEGRTYRWQASVTSHATSRCHEVEFAQTRWEHVRRELVEYHGRKPAQAKAIVTHLREDFCPSLTIADA